MMGKSLAYGVVSTALSLSLLGVATVQSVRLDRAQRVIEQQRLEKEELSDQLLKEYRRHTTTMMRYAREGK